LKSWTLEEYLDAFSVCNESLWNEMRNIFDDACSKEEAIKKKFFYVGGCASWMFGYDISESQNQINEELARISDLKSVLAGLQGIAGSNGYSESYFSNIGYYFEIRI
jgi:hypothetical protein